MSKRTEADSIINNHVLWALGGGLIPVPLVDFAAVTAIQVDMLNQLSHLYEIKFAASTGKRLVAALTGTTLAKLGSSFLKVIPGIGTVLGGLSMSILSGASTYAVGQVAIEHFESGGDLFNFDMDNAKKTYDDAFEKGKEVAQKMKQEQDAAAEDQTQTEDSTPEEDIYEALEKLGQLRDKGIITEEEFQAKKESLLERI